MQNNLLLANPAGDDKLYVEDVFSTWLYTGNGSTQTINNGIDLAGKGGLVWLADRNGSNHALFDTNRPVTQILSSNNTNITTNDSGWGLTSFGSTGFSLNATSYISVNNSSSPYVSWTFRKAAKFFDVVTWTGNGVAGRTISHSLGAVPGMIIVRQTSGASDWSVYHRSLGNTSAIELNLTGAAYTHSRWNNTTPTATSFTVSNSSYVNAAGQTYIAYIFAHDTTADGIVQCGTFSYSSATGASVNLGWEPQFILYKSSTANGGGTNWIMHDTMRGMPVPPGGTATISANQQTTEGTGFNRANPTATGFVLKSGLFASDDFIYLAIRRGPMRTPTDATKIFAPAVAGSSGATPSYVTNFPPDLAFSKWPGGTGSWQWADRLRGAKELISNTTDAETTGNYVGMYQNGAFSTYFDNTYRGWLFRRAPSFFDVVCYTGTGSARTVSHNLGVAPELMIIKRRNTTGEWMVGHSYNWSNAGYLMDNSAFATNGSSYWNTPTTTGVGLIGGWGQNNASGSTYVMYLFASCPGISKVGSYTGNGSSQNIDCGFTNGARFVLIKRTNSTGDWYVWDTARGIIAANDPHLSLNSTAAEVTTNDTIDPLSTGFTVNQVAATNVNVSGGTYIYLAIA